jgi:hypothetical protein
MLVILGISVQGMCMIRNRNVIDTNINAFLDIIVL